MFLFSFLHYILCFQYVLWAREPEYFLLSDGIFWNLRVSRETRTADIFEELFLYSRPLRSFEAQALLNNKVCTGQIKFETPFHVKHWI